MGKPRSFKSTKRKRSPEFGHGENWNGTDRIWSQGKRGLGGGVR